MKKSILKQLTMETNFKRYLLKQPEKPLSMVLYLVALHSFLMGIIMVTQPSLIMKLAGFSPECERFFPAQGGVFHILMAVAYLMGAVDVEKYHYIIIFSIVVKSVATVFLLVYCFTVEFKWIILLSGIGDCLMGLMIFLSLLYSEYSQLSKKNKH